MDDQLCDMPVTGRKLEELLSTSPYLHFNGHKLISAEASVIGENQGFTSTILRVCLKWSDPASDLPKSVIVKVIGSKSLSEMMAHMGKEHIDRMYEQLYHAHNIECIIYDLPGLRDIVPMPKCYGKVRSVKGEPGIIILEDLSDIGVVLPLTTWGLDFSEGKLDQALQALTSVHAWSVNHTEWRKNIPTLIEFNCLAPLLESMVAMFPASKKMYPDLFKDLDEDKVSKHINSDKYLELYGCDTKARYNLPRVLVHGDVHIMNMMFNRQEDDSAGDKLVALIDWQISHQGCAAEDLARILVICLSTKQRRENKDKLLRRYVELFNSKVKDSENRITFEDMKRALDDMFAFFGVMWSCGIAMFEQMKTLIKLKGVSDEEMDAITKRMLDYNFANYNDAMEYLKW